MGLHKTEVLSKSDHSTITNFKQVGLDRGLPANNIVCPMILTRAQLTFAGDLLWIGAVTLIQLSVLHYFLRTFHRRGVKLATYILIGLSWSLGIASLFAHVFLCSPVDQAWLPTSDGKCGNRETLRFGSAIAEAGLEALILLVSFPTLWKLDLSIGRKLAVASAHALGLL